MKAVVAAEPSVQRTVVAAMKQEAKQLHTTKAVVPKRFVQPVHLEGLDLITSSYSKGVYGCV
jgi:hypothetical protein